MRKKKQAPVVQPKPPKLYSAKLIKQVLEEEYTWTFPMVRDLLRQLEKRKVANEK